MRLLPILAAAQLFLSLSLVANELVKDEELVAHKVTLDVAKDLHTRFGLEPIGIGGSIENSIDGFALTLRTYKPLSLEQARTCLSECVAAYLGKINSTPELQSFLSEKPFTAKGLTLQILVLDQNDAFKTQNSLANFYLDNGKAVYKNFNPQTRQLEKIHEESFGKQ